MTAQKYVADKQKEARRCSSLLADGEDEYRAIKQIH